MKFFFLPLEELTFQYRTVRQFLDAIRPCEGAQKWGFSHLSFGFQDTCPPVLQPCHQRGCGEGDVEVSCSPPTAGRSSARFGSGAPHTDCSAGRGPRLCLRLWLLREAAEAVGAGLAPQGDGLYAEGSVLQLASSLRPATRSLFVRPQQTKMPSV